MDLHGRRHDPLEGFPGSKENVNITNFNQVGAAGAGGAAAGAGAGGGAANKRRRTQ